MDPVRGHVPGNPSSGKLRPGRLALHPAFPGPDPRGVCVRASAVPRGPGETWTPLLPLPPREPPIPHVEVRVEGGKNIVYHMTDDGYLKKLPAVVCSSFAAGKPASPKSDEGRR